MYIRASSTIRHRAPTSRILAFAVLLPLTFALAACGSTTRTSQPAGPLKQGGGIYKVGNPYQISGIWYYPHEDDKYDSTGIASWYGPQFHGKHTANGEIFDENALTAAHPTLPLPVLARVTNLENGKSIIVRVNDRGPFAAGREIDMSKHSAELLGFMKKGTAKVRVQYVGRAPIEGGIGDGMGIAETFIAPPVETDSDERQIAVSAPVIKVATVSTAALAAPAGFSTTPNAAPSTPVDATMNPIPDKAPAVPNAVQQVPVTGPGNVYVQAGSFQNLQNAQSVQQQLAGLGHVEIQTTTVDGTPFYRVRIGPLADVPSADSSLQSVIAHGHKGARIVVD